MKAISSCLHNLCVVICAAFCGVSLFLFSSIKVEASEVNVDTDKSLIFSVKSLDAGNSDGLDRARHPASLSESQRTEAFSLKTNLLYYAILMPNVQVEWKFAARWSAALEGQGAWYAGNNPHKVYRVATLLPEVRYWPIQRSRWHGMYVGLFGGPGVYDISNGKKGHKGEGGMVGVSAGYMWPISTHLSLEAGLGLGYMRLRDKEYVPVDDHFLYRLTKNINYFGPLRVNLSLVWRIPGKNKSVK